MPPEADKAWFEAETTDDLVTLLDAEVSAIEVSTFEKNRVTQLIRDLELYTGTPLSGMHISDLSSYGDLATKQDLSYNVVYSVVSTIVSRVCSFRPRAQFISDAGNFKTFRLSRNLNAASDAWAKKNEYQAEAAQAFRDCLTGPGGVLKTYIEGKIVKTARFPAWEIKIAEDDSKYGDAECVHHVRYVPLSQALGQYGTTPEAKEAIGRGASRLSTQDGFSGFCTKNGKMQVRIVDSYKRTVDDGMGRHTIMVGDHVAHDDTEWSHDAHPFDFFIFDREQQGIWGRSAISPIRTVQENMDEHLAIIAQAHHLSAKLIVSVPAETTAPEKITNEPVQIFARGPNGDMHFHNPSAVDAGTYTWFQILKQMAFEILGVSANAAQATKPAGVTAAVAIEAVTDLQSDRLSQLSHQWEQMVIKVGSWWYRLSADLGAGGEEYIAVERNQSRSVKFEAGQRKPTIDVFPTSLFGVSVSSRLQKTMDLVKAGWMDKEAALRLLDVPDLGGVLDLELADSFYAESLVDGILFDNAWETPDEWTSPVRLFEYSRKRYLSARAAKDDNGKPAYPAENLATMRKLLDYLQPIAQAAADKASGKVPASLVPTPTPQAAPALPGLAQTPEAMPLAA